MKSNKGYYIPAIFSKLFLAFILTMLIAGRANAGISGGIKVNLGMGKISSANLENNLNYQNDLDPQITEWNVKQSWGFGFGFGGFVTYSISDRFAFIAEPTLNYLNCKIDFTRIENKVSGGDGDITTDATASDIHVSTFSIPILAQYQLGPGRFVIQGGLGINMIGTSKITSTGTSSKDSYKNGLLDKTTTDPSFTLETDLDVFESPRFDFVIGVGKIFDLNGKDLSLVIRYYLPLTASEMYTTDGGYNDGRFKQNNLLGIDGKADAEKNAPILLNDFKMSSLSISVGLSLFGK